VKVKVRAVGHKAWVNKALTEIEKVVFQTINRALLKVRGQAQKQYLTGPRPQHLGVRTGNLRRNLMTVTTLKENSAKGYLFLRSIARYGIYWEAEERKGQVFSNGTPKYRPFVKPAWEDLKDRILLDFQKRIVEALR